jgi:hypothetical protein
MAVERTTSRWTYVPNGITTAFPFDSLVLQATDLAVNYYDASGGLVALPDYAVTGLGSAGGGTVSFVSPPAVVPGGQLVIERATVPLQQANYRNFRGLPAETQERMADKPILLIQELLRSLRRTVQLSPLDATDTELVFPPEATRAGKLLAFGPDGKQFDFLNLQGNLLADAAGTMWSQYGAGAVSRSVQAKLREVELSVEDFWLAIDADDLNSINRAIAAVPAGGGTVVFNRALGSEYKISGPIVINRGNMALRGKHGGTVGIESTSLTANHVTIGAVGAPYLFNIHLSDLVFMRSSVASAGWAIDATNIGYATFERLRVYGDAKQYQGLRFRSATNIRLIDILTENIQKEAGYFGGLSAAVSATDGNVINVTIERWYNSGSHRGVMTAVTTTNGSPNLTAVASTRGVAVGHPISGPGIPGGATVLSFVPNTSIVMSANASASATVTATINASSSLATQGALVLGDFVQGFFLERYGSDSHKGYALYLAGTLANRAENTLIKINRLDVESGQTTAGALRIDAYTNVFVAWEWISGKDLNVIYVSNNAQRITLTGSQVALAYVAQEAACLYSDGQYVRVTADLIGYSTNAHGAGVSLGPNTQYFDYIGGSISQLSFGVLVDAAALLGRSIQILGVRFTLNVSDIFNLQTTPNDIVINCPGIPVCTPSADFYVGGTPITAPLRVAWNADRINGLQLIGGVPGSFPNLIVRSAGSFPDAHVGFNIVTRGTGNLSLQRNAGQPGGPQAALTVLGAAQVAGETCLAVTYHDGAAMVHKQIVLGGPDSGGAGYRALRVPN